MPHLRVLSIVASRIDEPACSHSKEEEKEEKGRDRLCNARCEHTCGIQHAHAPVKIHAASSPLTRYSACRNLNLPRPLLLSVIISNCSIMAEATEAYLAIRTTCPSIALSASMRHTRNGSTTCAILDISRPLSCPVLSAMQTIYKHGTC